MGVKGGKRSLQVGYACVCNEEMGDWPSVSFFFIFSCAAPFFCVMTAFLITSSCIDSA